MNNPIPYFPYYCVSSNSMELLEAEFGLKGIAIILKLYQKIYGQQGYYCDWNAEVDLLFSIKVCGLLPGDKSVSEVVMCALRRGIFHSSMYDQFGILTSQEIQENFFEATKRRTKTEVEKRYLLLSVPKNINIVDNSRENVDRNDKNVYRNETRKEDKENKEDKEEILPNSFEMKAALYLRDEIVKNFPKQRVPSDENICKWASDIEKLKRIDGYSEEEIRDIINFAVGDDFWQSNILSAKKLREKRETLFAQMQMKKRNQNQLI